MEVEKHRTLLFADYLEESRQMLGRCTITPVDTAIGPAGTAIWLPGQGDDDDSQPAGARITPLIGRFPRIGIWNGEPGMSRSIEAMIFPYFNKSHTMVTWKGQNFAAFSTEWENHHSPLVNPSARPEPTPIIDACGVVVGYYLKKVSTKFLFTNDDGEIFFATQLSTAGPYGFHAEHIVGRDLYIRAADSVSRYADDNRENSTQHTSVTAGAGDNAITSTHVVGGYTYRIQADKYADLLLDIDGFVQVLDTYGDAKSKSWAEKYNEAAADIPLLGMLMPRIPIPPDDKCFERWDDDAQMDAFCANQKAAFIGDSMMLLFDILSLGTSKVAKGMLNVGRRLEQAAMRTARSTAVALTLELRAPKALKPVRATISNATKRLLLPDGRLAEPIGLRLSGYSQVMGIPKDHFGKMVQAAKEANGIAVFRANKPAAIPLIERGAHPKPKHYNAFKSSRETGVLTAKEQAHIETAYKYGDYVVDEDLVARRTIIRDGQKVTEELKLNNPYWKVEKGQVIKPDGVPIVGDYDLLGFLPSESPGRNIARVPNGHVIDDVKGDWVGPDVERYQSALNSKFDKPGPRVLHGAQDQFSHSQFGGFTDDIAYAVYGDGRAVIMEGRQAQEAFYKAYRRQTAMGAYPRPSPGTPVVDEVGAMRARKAGQ
jgi:hypothetical protein